MRERDRKRSLQVTLEDSRLRLCCHGDWRRVWDDEGRRRLTASSLLVLVQPRDGFAPCLCSGRRAQRPRWDPGDGGREPSPGAGRASGEGTKKATVWRCRYENQGEKCSSCLRRRQQTKVKPAAVLGVLLWLGGVRGGTRHIRWRRLPGRDNFISPSQKDFLSCSHARRRTPKRERHVPGAALPLLSR